GLTLPGNANPISGSEVQADVTLTGKLCGQEAFYCGTGSGQLTQPLSFDLTGSTWTLDEYVGSNPPNPPLIDCNKTPAGPAPQSPSP
ncbi:MAG: hypothetical protein DYH12_23075, partial [Sorangiineae bacterium PRO1]|nr:hypothetical protein [Sorangiineae bacterium PRO1]